MEMVAFGLNEVTSVVETQVVLHNFVVKEWEMVSALEKGKGVSQLLCAECCQQVFYSAEGMKEGSFFLKMVEEKDAVVFSYQRVFVVDEGLPLACGIAVGRQGDFFF
ncbi:hypothetical protein AAFF_G00080170 [Aldrovandia affinis]|uniref:Uncharacterized protein n=1 Tax=Aldrovandia affinis TaxID=143900 RepID=A0AAD7T336_9TELE|nr:hypothetical protein AAFF_G00080170 [Aldrovandia affinis]